VGEDRQGRGAQGGRLSVQLPYRIEEEPDGAEHLLVTWPGLHPGGAPPSATVERLKRVRAHRLAIGADEHTYVGPRGTLQGAHASVAILRAEARRLGIPRENIVAYGPSMRAVTALWMGFRAQVGRIIVGGAPLYLGRRLRELDRVMGPSPEAVAYRERFLALAARDDGTPGDVVLDGLIPEALEGVTEQMTVRLLISHDDEMFRDSVALYQRLDEHPVIDGDLVIREYGNHGGLKDAFKAYLTEALIAAGVPRHAQ